MWFNPATLAEALALKTQHGGALQAIAGGTDLMVTQRSRPPSHSPPLLNLNGLDELRGIDHDAHGVTIGATTPFATIRHAAVVGERLPMLAASSAVTGALPIQNRATLGGNIMNASPAADTPPVLLSYGAQLILNSARGERRLPYEQFHDAYRHTRCAPDELLTGIYIPFPTHPGATHYYRKVGTRHAQAISKLTLAALLVWQAGRIAHSAFGLASVAATPAVANRLSQYLFGKSRDQLDPDAVRAALAHDIQPRDDLRSSAVYRRRVAGNLVLQALAGEPQPLT